jgi:Cu2+-exporting ATPase
MGKAELAVSRVDGAQGEACFHCGEPVPDNADFVLSVGGKPRPMCCPGCRAVASLIAGSGLEKFYEQRTSYNERPASRQAHGADAFTIYDDPKLLQRFSRRDDLGRLQLRLLVGGMTCAACTWLIEKTLLRLPAVSEASLNLSRQRLDVTLDDAQIPVSELFARISSLGYRVQPWHGSRLREQNRAEYRQDLRRLAVAGIGMMQVGMFAIALHAGDLQGISDEYRALMRWASLLITTIVVLFSARSFFESAWRHLRAGALVMDTPVALAIGLAWLSSTVATVTGQGEVYFDSVVMFTFLLLLARFVEKRVRQRDAQQWHDAESLLPDAVQRWSGRDWQRVPRVDLRRGDRLLIRRGETLPVDGTVLSGHSALREDSFSGESLPRPVEAGATVFAGTVNLEDTLELEASGSFADTRLAALQQAIDQAQQRKPALERLADRIAGRFVAGVLLLTAATALVWWQVDAGRALWVSLSVLVISCPCALSLATPAALAGAASALRRQGIIVYGENALETLPRCSHMLFDKTGTLTSGKLRLERLERLADDWPEEEVMAVAAELQRHSTHPVGDAFAELSAPQASSSPATLSSTSPLSPLSGVHYQVGQGLRGEYRGRNLRMGSLTFCRQLCPGLPAPPDAGLYWVALCDERRAIAWFGLGDDLRPEAEGVLRALAAQRYELELLTGDASPRAGELGHALGFAAVRTGQTPQDKTARVSALQKKGHQVAMVGDGLNDAPVLKLADASIAVTGASDLARAQADIVLLRGDLQQLLRVVQLARKTHRTIVQNFAWALGYNAIGIPLAALGLVPPWAAALGMSLSSLLVVANSLRLRRTAGRD